MESSTARLEREQRKKAEILKQIANLQAQLGQIPGSGDQPIDPPSTPKRKQPDSSCLVPPTPSPKKRKLDPNSSLNKGHNSSGRNSKAPDALKTSPRAPPVVVRQTPAKPQTDTPPPKPAPSNVLTTLAGPKRDDRLALVEDLKIGPAEHLPPFDDPFFKQLEPNSGIRLKSRVLEHDDVQEYLRGRYYLSPSRLYSVVRLLPDKQGYEVPVDGDLVTIAVVAERGPIMFSRAPVGIGREEDDNSVEDDLCSPMTGGDAKPNLKSKGERKTEPVAKASGKKYVNIKLVDFGARSSSSATGGKALIRGDALLTLLLFESDSFDLITRDDGGNPEKVYKGGSRGGFESMSKLKEGDVIALLNPKILKPFQRSGETPHPVNNILALTPESASSIIVIGRARDLGMCTAVKRDNKLCGSWCDKRVSDVCDWHIQHAVQRRRAARPEFSIGTSGMTTSSAPKLKPAYDPVRKWGLKPEESQESGSGATYIVSGHVVGGSGSSHSMYVAETIGREGQAKASRQLARKDTDRALQALLERDKEGMKAVVKAREAVTRQNQDDSEGKTRGKSKGKACAVDLGDDAAAIIDSSANQKPSYSAEVIKHLGFDPASKPGQRRDSLTVQKKLETLAAVQSSRKGIELGPKPGQRIRSGVFVPLQKASGVPEDTPTDASATSIRDSGQTNGPLSNTKLSTGKMIDLDDSEGEL